MFGLDIIILPPVGLAPDAHRYPYSIGRTYISVSGLRIALDSTSTPAPSTGLLTYKRTSSAMTKLTIYLVTYDRGTYDLSGETKPYHWSFFTQIELKGIQNLGIAHQLRGMPGSFYYQGPERVDLARSGSLKEELEIGQIDEEKVNRIHEILSKVRIDKVESSRWNCQDWALDGLEEMKKEGFVYSHFDANAVKNWLKER